MCAEYKLEKKTQLEQIVHISAIVPTDVLTIPDPSLGTRSRAFFKRQVSPLHLPLCRDQ